MRTLRRIAHSPTHPLIREWRAELLVTGVMVGGIVSMLLH